MKKTRKCRDTGQVTSQEVTNLTDVGVMTISYALKTPEQVSDRLRGKVEQAVKELGYIPNRTTNALASGCSHAVAVPVPSLTDKASSCSIQSL